jgi:type VII secretion-associated serine protease mycosin
MAISASVAGSQSLTATPSFGLETAALAKLTYKAAAVSRGTRQAKSLAIEDREISTPPGLLTWSYHPTMPSAASRAACVVLSAVLAGALTPVAQARAFAPACQTRPAPAAPAPTQSEIPWAQQRLGDDRVNALADGRGVTVAVIDSGVAPDHPQLAGAVRPGADLLDPPGDGRLDCVGHGTAVASIVAARRVEGVGFRGLAPGSTIVALRVSEQVELDGTTAGRTAGASGLAAAIRKAVDLRAGVLNLSLVAYRDDDAVRAAVRYAIERDVVVVAAVGNRFADGNPTPYPAAYDGVIGIGAVGNDGRRLAGSQVGPWVDLVAPGGNVVTAALPQGYTVREGTSFAVPFVAATAALVRQYRPELTAQQIAQRLIATADPAPSGPRSPEYGAGVLNPYRALTDQIGGPLPSTAPSGAPLAAPDSGAAPSGPRTLPLTITAAALLLAALGLLAAAVVPRGRRRRWQPGLRVISTQPDDVDPTAPAFGEPSRRRPGPAPDQRPLRREPGP